MGLFDFMKGSGKKVTKGKEADEIKQTVRAALGDKIDQLGVSYSEGTVTLSGVADSYAEKEQAVLIAGNIEGVEKVNDDHLRVQTATAAAAPAVKPHFYTIQKGDSLSVIAKRQYGDANKWQQLYEANRAVIGSDPDKIYPGQQIRVPQL